MYIHVLSSIFRIYLLYIHGSVHHEVLMKMTNKVQLRKIIYCSLTALRVSSDIFAHHQEHHNCIYSFWYYSRTWLPAGVVDEVELLQANKMQPSCWPATFPPHPRYLPAATYVNNIRSCKYSCDAPDDERKYRSKHVELSMNNKLSYAVAPCWSFS